MMPACRKTFWPWMFLRRMTRKEEYCWQYDVVRTMACDPRRGEAHDNIRQLHCSKGFHGAVGTTISSLKREGETPLVRSRANGIWALLIDPWKFSCDHGVRGLDCFPSQNVGGGDL